MEEKIDILLATYNTKTEYLKQQIDSIINQTYKNFRLLISDDASSKIEVKKILEDYQKKDNRIFVYTQEKNLGYNKNFEYLLTQATAPFIMFSDHDDVWYPQKIEKSIEKIKKDKVDLVYVNCNQINENNEIIKENYFKYKNIPLVNGKSKLAMSRCIGTGCSQIITKNVRDEMIPFKDDVIAHDWLSAFIANQGKGISYIKEPLFGYRLHNSNVFGGRSLAQNLEIWKKNNGKSYKSYLKYRQEKVINQAYLEGATMCLEYVKNQNDRKYLEDKYYQNLKKSKYINFHIVKYFKFLGGKNLLKKMIKEIISFHIPIARVYNLLNVAKIIDKKAI